ncbi:MAG: response regulator transcription factor [Arcobacteraceae bacterium]|nr:response regulator transcription factor [Arcobacteraceae bacterium]
MNNLLKIIKNLTILYIEDEKEIREVTLKTLMLLCENVIALENCNNAYEVYEKLNPNIIITDIMLDKISGIEFTKTVRENNRDIPIILLSASTDTTFLLDAVKLKLIDYLVKPIKFDNLVSVLKRATEYLIENGQLHIYITDNIIYDISFKTLTKDNQEVKLTTHELVFLELLLKNRYRVLSIEEIKNIVWYDGMATDGALKGLLHKLRKKLGKDTIVSSSGIGYRIDIKNKK